MLHAAKTLADQNALTTFRKPFDDHWHYNNRGPSKVIFFIFLLTLIPWKQTYCINLLLWILLSGNINKTFAFLVCLPIHIIMSVLSMSCMFFSAIYNVCSCKCAFWCYTMFLYNVFMMNDINFNSKPIAEQRLSWSEVVKRWRPALRIWDMRKFIHIENVPRTPFNINVAVLRKQVWQSVRLKTRKNFYRPAWSGKGFRRYNPWQPTAEQRFSEVVERSATGLNLLLCDCTGA